MNTNLNISDRADPQILSSAAPHPRRFAAAQFAALAVIGAGVVWALLAAAMGDVWAGAVLWPLCFYAGGAMLALIAMSQSYPHRRIGLCNVVTLLRFALIAALVAAFVPGVWQMWQVAALAVTAFALDGVDGWLARRARLTSAFGARFDVEVDSIFALLLAALAVQGGLSPLVLLLGVPRYAFGLAQMIEPRLTGDLPERFSRKVVCVVQIAVLIVLVLPMIDPMLRHIVAAAAGGLVIWSFAVDIRALLRAAR